MYEMKRLGRDAAELTALADHLTAHGLVLEILGGRSATSQRRRSCTKGMQAATIFSGAHPPPRIVL